MHLSSPPGPLLPQVLWNMVLAMLAVSGCINSPIDFTILEKKHTTSNPPVRSLRTSLKQRAIHHVSERTNTDTGFGTNLPQEQSNLALLDVACTYETKPKMTVIHSSTISL